MNYFTFNGIKKPYIKIIRGRERPAWAPLNRVTTKHPRLAGEKLIRTGMEVREITVPVLIEHDGIPDLQKVKEDMAAWLVTKEPKALIFSDEPDRTYYAAVEGGLDLEELTYWGNGTINFVCPDPYKYGQPHKTIALKKYTWEEYAGQSWRDLIGS
ncbi:distal tail protein Dit [Virgibacillus dokdonensis]|uniref:distal tail protein Dit n=1 Tax=Virgibacillus dokdonensis TaxID=302167 RepID=UPI00098AFE0E|nr:distal tail protein Dit [Virgibacillus dokdonensis]